MRLHVNRTTLIALGKGLLPYVPALAIAIFGGEASTAHGAAAAVAGADPTQGVDDIKNQWVMPLVEKTIGVASIGTIGAMAFQPRKEEMVKHMFGVGVAGTCAVGFCGFMDKVVFAHANTAVAATQTAQAATGALF